MVPFKPKDKNHISRIDSFLKTLSRFAIVYVVALAVCSLVSFSSSYQYFCAIAALLIALFDLIKCKSRLFNLSFLAQQETLETAISDTLASVEDLRKTIVGNEDKDKSKTNPQGKAQPADLVTLSKAINRLNEMVKFNRVVLEHHNHFLNDIQNQISVLPNAISEIDGLKQQLQVISTDFPSAISEIEDLKKQIHTISTARNSSVSSKEAKLSQIMRDIDVMEGHDFEYYCAGLLERAGYESVSVTKGSGDQGVDVLGEKDGIKYAFQCKCYKSALSNKAVQEIHAGKNMYGCQIGVVITNNYFTPGARELASATGVLLWDRSILKKMITEAT